MKKIAFMAAFGITMLLTGCGHQKEPKAPPPKISWHHWVCDSGLVADWVFEDASGRVLQLRLDNNSTLHVLEKQYQSDLGTLYTNANLGFRVNNNSGLVFKVTSDEVLGKDCVGTAGQ